MLREFDEPVRRDPLPPRPAWLTALLYGALGWWTVMLAVSVWRSFRSG